MDMKIKMRNESPNPMPEYKTPGSAGMDLRAYLKEDYVLEAGERKVFPTGLYLELPRGYEAQVRPRSGLSAKYGVCVLNSPGTIDSDYRGEIGVALINLSKEDYTVHNGDRIAQLVFTKVTQVEIEPVDALDETERGEGGFGHTGME